MIPSILGPTEHDNAVSDAAKSSVRAEKTKSFALGNGVSIGLAIVFGAYELLHSDPHEAFPLLRSWGPWAIVSLAAIYVFYDLARWVMSLGKRGVIAIENVSVALGKLADRDDRNIQEMQTLTSYTSRGLERNTDFIHALNANVNDKFEALHTEMLGLRDLIVAKKEG